jgi:trans-2,3-dihydro-3-hydroxyanthranilate isomerase
MLPLASLEALGRAQPDFANWGAVRAATKLEAVYPFVAGDGGRVRARMFVPVTIEDPATGSAAGPLGAYAARYLRLDRLVIEQGVEMGRPSTINVEMRDGRPRVGGSAVVVASGELRLP